MAVNHICIIIIIILISSSSSTGKGCTHHELGLFCSDGFPLCAQGESLQQQNLAILDLTTKPQPVITTTTMSYASTISIHYPPLSPQSLTPPSRFHSKVMMIITRQNLLLEELEHGDGEPLERVFSGLENDGFWGNEACLGVVMGGVGAEEAVS